VSRRYPKRFDRPFGVNRCQYQNGVAPIGSAYLKAPRWLLFLTTALTILWGNAAMSMNLKSPFKQNEQIPSKYTCEGEDVSLPLA
jgi:hypothetical protein